jgi:ketosteroid isomerase-like protein
MPRTSLAPLSVAIFLTLALAGCATASIPSELMRIDAEFARLSVEKSAAAAFETYLAPDAIELENGGDVLRGKKAIVASLSPASPAGAFILSWTPEAADVSGDLGYTWGRFTLQSSAADGTKQMTYGKYVTVWKRQSDGTWKAALDLGNKSPPPAAGALVN